MRMYKYSFLIDQTKMPIAAPGNMTRPETNAGRSAAELVKLLARHPAVALTAAMSSGVTSTPRPLPALARIWDDAVTPLDVNQLVAAADIVFLALPEAASAEIAPRLLDGGARVIDLSGAFRIRDAADRQRWYPTTGSIPDGTVYGLPER